MKKLSLLLAGLGVSLAAAAIPADPTPNRVAQPSGDSLTIRLVGDEFFHYNTTVDGYTLLQDGKGGYVYAMPSGTRLVSSGLLAHDPAGRTPAEHALLATLSKHLTEAEGISRAKARRAERDAQPAMKLPQTGFKGLVILINCTDKKFSGSNPSQFYSDMYGKKGYTGFYYNGSFQDCPGSTRDYFYDQSTGQFDPQFDVVGPVEVDYSCLDYHSTSNAWEIFLAAINAADASVDFSQYDNDGDGFVDMVYFVTAGYSANYSGNNSGYLWPHKSYLYDHNTYTFPMLDGVYIALYASSTEIYGWESQGSTMPLGIGTFCHEFSHVLGLPDLYDTDYASGGGQSHHPGDWDVMASGTSYYGRYPCSYTIWERYALGWATPTVITAPGNYSLENVATGNQGFILRTPVDKEFFMLDNRQKTGWDRYLPGHGMIVARVDSTDVNVWDTDAVNCNPAHNYYELLRAGGGTLGDDDDDPFPGTNNVTQLDNNTTPNLLTWAGLPNAFALSNISESDGVITFKVDGSDPFDVNQDGTVNIADVNIVVDVVLGTGGDANCDFNHDGVANIADVNLIVNHILGI